MNEWTHDVLQWMDATPFVSNMSIIWTFPAMCCIMKEGLFRVISTAAAVFSI